MNLRLFVALPVPQEVKARLAELQQELRAQLPPKTASWTRAENLHLTLRFLGEVDSERVPELSRHLTEAAAGSGPLMLMAERLGCFPDLRYPRVLWAWVHDRTPAGESADSINPPLGARAVIVRPTLLNLYHRLAEATVNFTAEPPEPSFTGHLTVARLKQIKPPQAKGLAKVVEAAANRQFGSWQADRVHLIRSELRPEGSRYSTLTEVAL